MPLVHWMAVAALAISPAVVVAQTAGSPPDPTDPYAEIPAFNYESAFKTYRFATDQDISPDKTWRTANDEMRGLGGHMGHAQDAGNAKNQPPSGPAPARHDMQHHGEGQ